MMALHFNFATYTYIYVATLWTLHLGGGPKISCCQKITDKSHRWGSIFHQFWVHNEQKNTCVMRLYTMYDLIFDVIICYVWSGDTLKINAYDQIMNEIEKNKKNMEIKECFANISV